MSTLKVSAIAHPSAASAAFTLNSDGTVTTGPGVNFGSFVAGTVMLFVQTSSPTGWTKSTTHNDKALRVVSGSASSGGSTAFTSVFTSRSASGTVGSTTLTESQIPSHTHSASGAAGSNGTGGQFAFSQNAATTTKNTNATGGGGSHDHSFTGTAMDFAVQYVDVIIATKD